MHAYVHSHDKKAVLDKHMKRIVYESTLSCKIVRGRNYMKLLGQEVKHKKFGRGVIVEQQENKVAIAFKEGQKLFVFPDAFQQYLVICDTKLKKEIEVLNQQRQKEIQAEKQKQEKEREYQNRMYTMKIPTKSQAAYNIQERELQELEFLDTGHVLTGKAKGSVRKPVNIQPNSGILLTDYSGDERLIWGIAMPAHSFWGKECTDGKIVLHHKYKIVLSEEERVSFWKYFKKDSVRYEWGSIPYKYFETQTMEEIMYDICKRLLNTEHEEEMTELYSYFCNVNRIPEKIIRNEENQDT